MTVDPPPLLASEHRRTLEQHDPADCRLERSLEERPRAESELLGRIGRGGRGLRHSEPELLLDRLEDGPEEVALVGVLVIEGAARHAGARDQILRGRRGIAFFGEELGRDPDETLLGLA